MKQLKTASSKTPRAPIVAVMGHVDHGKTTLLDTIRKTHITEAEAGGITQHIGAYQVQVPKFKSQIPNASDKITFIDTPGHEAFSKMRERGGAVADFAILVVAATEGVKPQTEESIAHIKKAAIPVIVAMTKMDLPQADPDRVKQQLAKLDILVENFGGTVVAIPVSAKSGLGVDKLLETILLFAAMNEISADPKDSLEAVVIESKMDKHKGPLAAVIVKNGTLNTGDTIFAEDIEAKVRAMTDSQGKLVKKALPGDPVEIMGWKKVPLVGARVTLKPLSATAGPIRFEAKPFSLPPLSTINKLKIILKADTVGTLEAIKENLDLTQVEIVSSGVGHILESDILHGKSTGSAIIGFAVPKPTGKVELLAKTEKVRVKVYAIIYELLEEISEVIQLMNKPEAAETVLGGGTIIAEFDFDDQKVAGVKVEQGRIGKSDQIKIMRADKEFARTRLKSLRQGKKDVSKVEAGAECGLVFDKKLDFRLGDRIIAFKTTDLLA